MNLLERKNITDSEIKRLNSILKYIGQCSANIEKLERPYLQKQVQEITTKLENLQLSLWEYSDCLQIIINAPERPETSSSNSD